MAKQSAAGQFQVLMMMLAVTFCIVITIIMAIKDKSVQYPDLNSLSSTGPRQDNVITKDKGGNSNKKGNWY